MTKPKLYVMASAKVGTIIVSSTKEMKQVLVLGLELKRWVIVRASTMRHKYSYKLYLDHTVSLVPWHSIL